jgi:hypothetical protein
MIKEIRPQMSPSRVVKSVQWMMSLFRGCNNRNAIGRRGAWVMSALALAIGVTNPSVQPLYPLKFCCCS